MVELSDYIFKLFLCLGYMIVYLLVKKNNKQFMTQCLKHGGMNVYIPGINNLLVPTTDYNNS